MILGITTATVGKHIEHIYPKLGVENRTAAASFTSELTGNARTRKAQAHRIAGVTPAATEARKIAAQQGRFACENRFRPPGKLLSQYG